jgi:hypothetical protein
MDALKDFYDFYRPLQRKYDLQMIYKTNSKEAKITIRQRGKELVKGLDMYDKEVHLIFEPNTMFYSSGETGGWYKVDPTTICRCTGLKDKNGKLI